MVSPVMTHLIWRRYVFSTPHHQGALQIYKTDPRESFVWHQLPQRQWQTLSQPVNLSLTMPTFFIKFLPGLPNISLAKIVHYLLPSKVLLAYARSPTNLRKMPSFQGCSGCPRQLTPCNCFVLLYMWTRVSTCISFCTRILPLTIFSSSIYSQGVNSLSIGWLGDTYLRSPYGSAPEKFHVTNLSEKLECILELPIHDAKNKTSLQV